jgi:hypothetical protein
MISEQPDDKLDVSTMQSKLDVIVEIRLQSSRSQTSQSELNRNVPPIIRDSETTTHEN